MYFADNSIYSYLQSNHKKVYNIGWLDEKHEFQKGFVAPEIITKLERISKRMDVNLCRGLHFCQYCYKNPNLQLQNKWYVEGLCGNGEIWLPNRSFTKIFAAPSLIIHYIYEHQYLPPDEFIDAIAAYNFMRRCFFEQLFMRFLIKPKPDYEMN